MRGGKPNELLRPAALELRVKCFKPVHEFFETPRGGRLMSPNFNLKRSQRTIAEGLRYSAITIASMLHARRKPRVINTLLL